MSLPVAILTIFIAWLLLLVGLGLCLNHKTLADEDHDGLSDDEREALRIIREQGE